MASNHHQDGLQCLADTCLCVHVTRCWYDILTSRPLSIPIPIGRTTFYDNQPRDNAATSWGSSITRTASHRDVHIWRPTASSTLYNIIIRLTIQCMPYCIPIVYPLLARYISVIYPLFTHYIHVSADHGCQGRGCLQVLVTCWGETRWVVPRDHLKMVLFEGKTY